MEAKNFYFKGDYESASKEKNDLKSICYKIGGLIFIGQHQEARLLFRSFEERLDLDSLAVAYFHLGLSYTRTSDYNKAQEYFIKNISLARNSKLELESEFFVYQGAGFYRFFFSKHKKSQYFAERGYRCLLEIDNPPGLLLGLSLDIQAHNKVQLGYFNQGMKIFSEALNVTKNYNLKDLHSEIEISTLLYKSEFDTDLDKHIQILKKYLQKSKNKNDYSKSEIVLQVAKLYFLKGQFQQSNAFLNQHFDIVYKNQNKRKIALLNTLMSQLVLQKGQFLEALSIINVALSHLNHEVDKSLYLPLIGIKIKALKYLNKSTEFEEIEASKIVSGIDRTVNKNIQAREGGVVSARKIGDDKVADLMDQVTKKSKTVINEIIKNKFYFLLFKLYDLKPGRNYIIFLERTNTVMLVSDVEVLNLNRTLTKTQIQLLKLLSEKPQTKEELIDKVWKYQYDQLRHDPLIYTSIARLRRVLGDFGKLIYADENHYSLDSKIDILTPETNFESINVEKEAVIHKSYSNDLNYRQMSFLAEGDEKPVSVSEYGEKWGVTRMTALRDLKDLTKKKKTLKIGKGKATRYILVLD